MPAEESQLLNDTVADLVRSGADEDLKRVLAEQPSEDLADLLEHADPATREAVFDALPPSLAGEVASVLDETVREDLLEDVRSEQLAEMVAELEPDEALPLLEDVDPRTADEVLRRLDPEDADELRELLGYDEESAGRAMQFGAPAVRQEMTLGEAIAALREAAEEIDELQTVFVVDGTGRLRGFLPLEMLILRPPETPVVEVARRDLVFAYTYEDQETVAARARRSDLLSIPIIDSRGVLRGQIPTDRLREIVEEETSEDMYRMVGLAEDESVHASYRDSLGKRLPWLGIHLAAAVAAAWVISRFEGTIAQVAALAALQSIVAAQGGNAGVQTLTIALRAMALGDLDWRNSRRVFLKELALGLSHGVIVGGVTGLLAWAWRGNPWLALIVGGAMVLNMVAAALAGFCVPLLLRACRLDPAQASGVLVTAVADICGFLVFLGSATLLLPLIR